MNDSYSFDGPALRLHSPSEAAGLVPERGLSPTAFSDLSACPARWAAQHFQTHKVSAFSSARIGTGAHKALEAFYARPSSQRTFNLFQDCLDRVALGVADEFRLSRGKRLDWRSQLGDACGGIWAIEDPMRVDVFACEAALNGFELAGVPFFGVADRVRDVGGLLFIDDYKTSKRIPFYRQDPRHLEQLQLYILAMRKLGYTVGGARLLYVRLGKVCKVATSRPEMRNTLERFKLVWDDLHRWADEQAFPAVPSFVCARCPVSSGCPVSAHC